MRLSAQRPRLHFLLSAALACSAALGTRAEQVPTAFSGLCGDGQALFLPSGLTPETLPASLALLERPAITAPLGPDWRDRPEFSRESGRVRMHLPVTPGTSLYGTGEVTGRLLRNGTEIRLWNTDTPEYQVDGGRRLYQSHPWVLGVRPDGSSFGILADTTWAADLSLKDGITLTSDGPLFPVIVIERRGPADVVRALASLTGRIPLPPLWALGYQQCRWSYYPAARVREVADQFRARRIPCDVLWMDIDYMDGYRIFTVDRPGFGDPVALNAYLHEKGFKSVWMIDPGVKVDPGYPVYDSGTAADVWVHDRSGRPFQGSVWPGPCVFPDFTRQQTRTWWAAQYKAFMSLGIDGVWNDMNEPSVFDGQGKTMPLDAVHRGGEGLPEGTHAQYHNVFGMLMVRATREGVLAANPNRRPFVLSRSNYIGGQRYAATWTGDNGSTETFLDEAVPMSLNLSLSGQPFNGPDLGGFGENASPALWARWVSTGVFFPFCRAHASKGTNDKEPWAFGPEVENVARLAIQRRYRLLPYLYTLFRRSSVDGTPVMQPLFFADPADPGLRGEDRAFLLGGDLAIVPADLDRAIALPGGGWVALSLVPNDTTEPHQAMVMLRPGAIVPAGAAVQSTAEPILSTLSLYIALDSSGRASGELYEDAGDGFGYRSGDYLLTHYRAESDGHRVVVSIERQEGQRTRPTRSVNLEVWTAEGPLRAQGIDGDTISIPFAHR